MNSSMLFSHLAFCARDRRDGGDIGYCLVGELEIFFNVGGILDLCPDDGSGHDQGSSQKTPVGGELRHVSDLVGIEDGR